MSQAGTAVWFARHESRLAWRDFVSMMTAGRRTRARKVAIGFAVFIIIMHAIAYSVVGGYADAPIEPAVVDRASRRRCCCRGC